MSPADDLRSRALAYFRSLQDQIVAALEALDGRRFQEDAWERQGGGGGRSRVLIEGNVFEKAGVNFSDVHGELSEEFSKQIPGEGRSFSACGVSLVLHPRNPFVPTVHANFRFLSKGDSKHWFGGGADLTPFYPYREDVVHFHRTWRDVCVQHAHVVDYAHLKRWCDEYFYLPHRKEARGIGGIFYDWHDSGDWEADLAFTQDVGRAFLKIYPELVRRNFNTSWTVADREEQLIRRGRYVEFNLLYDRGTIFGLKTGGNVDSILSSMPPEVKWP